MASIETTVKVNLNRKKTRRRVRKGGIKILKMAGKSVKSFFGFRDLRTRALQGSQVDYELILEELCDTGTCDDSQAIADALYDDVSANMQVKIDSGEFQQALQDSGVASLSAAAVNSGDFSR